MGHYNQLAHIRQICHLDLPGQEIMVSLLEELHYCIPSRFNAFVSLDEQGQPREILEEAGIPSGDCRPKWVNTLVENLQMANGRATTICIDRGFVGDQQRPLPWGQGSALLGLAQGAGGTHGVVALLRVELDGPFTAYDQELLERLLPYIDHALLPRRAMGDSLYVSSGRVGVFILNSAGRLICACDQGIRLLRLATYTTPGNQVSLGTKSTSLEKIIDDLEVGGGSCTVNSIWGRFSFHAFYISRIEEGGNEEKLVCVTVEHLEAASLSMVKRLKKTPLSPTERQVVVMLVDGRTRSQISSRLNTTMNTAADHIRSIYGKLGVNSKQDLLRYFL